MSIASGNTNTDILIAGAFAALSIDLLVYPLDTIKTRIQAPNYKQLYTTANGAVDRALFRGLYQGIGSVILATVPSSGAFFTTYEASKSLLANFNSSLPQAYHVPTPLLHSASSAIAEAVSCFILTPAEVLKQNAQIIKKSAPSSSKSDSGSKLFDTAATKKALSKFSHPSQLWRGYTVLLARNLPYTAMQFPLFEALKVRLLEWWRKKQGKSGAELTSEARGGLLERGVITGIAAGLSGSLSAIVTTPIDVIKTRIMLAASSDAPSQEKKKAGSSAARAQQGGIAIGKEIWKQEGIKGLFRGGLLRGVWTALGSGLYLSVYESGRQFLEDRRKNDQDD